MKPCRPFPDSAIVSRRGAVGLLAAMVPGAGRTTAAELSKPWFVGPLPNPPAAPGSGNAAAARPEASTHDLHQWTRAVLRLVPKFQQNPLRAARALAYVQVALHDATWHAIRLWPQALPAHHELAAHRAASLLLAHLYPHQAQGQFEAAFVALAAKVDPAGAASDAVDALGRQVAQALIARSLTDGSGRVWSSRMRPAEFPGAWQPSWPLFSANPTEGLAGSWRPWLTASPGRYDPPPAARPGSEQHRRETREVLDVARRLDAEQARLARQWDLDAGSVTPGGVWMDMALRELLPAPAVTDSSRGVGSALQATTALALAMHDAFIGCWRVKMRDWSERPVTAVRRELDPAFKPLLVTPGFPAYVSGHATVSAAASEVLGHFLPRRQRAFAALAEEAAMSRLWGGIHFRSDNEQGLLLGRSIGQEVIARLPGA